MEKKLSPKAKRIMIIAIAAAVVVAAAAVVSILVINGNQGNTKDEATVVGTSVVTSVIGNTNATDENGNVIAETTSAEETTKADEKSESKADENSNADSSSAASDKSEEKSESNSDQGSDSSSAASGSENKNPTHVSDKACTVDGIKYYVGDTVTCDYQLTTPSVLVNFQGYITYDDTYLKVTDVKLNKPASAGGISNYKNLTEKINFNGSNISSGYDYTKGGTLITVTYEVVAEGDTSTVYHWQVATDFDNDTKYVTDGKPVDGLKIEKLYS